MKCVHTFGTGRHNRQADITLLFQYIIKRCNFKTFMQKRGMLINHEPNVSFGKEATQDHRKRNIQRHKYLKIQDGHRQP